MEMQAEHKIKALVVYAAGENTPELQSDSTGKEYTLIYNSQELAGLASNQYDEAKCVSFIPDDSALSTIFNVLKPLGKFVVENIPSREIGQSLAVELKIQGFLDIMAAKDPSGERFVVCQKPSWEVGATAAVSISTGSSEVKTWKMDTTDLADSDLIDENDLLDKNFTVDATAGADCGEMVGGKKRACKDCTCGLAEQEAAGIAHNSNATVEEKVVRASSCGNCGKGDAFRCATCPFLGKPAFEPGMERVILSMASDDI